jgi:hypothetical protein
MFQKRGEPMITRSDKRTIAKGTAVSASRHAMAVFM